jgi:flagellin-like hook-associated protein FlgL
MRISTQSLYQGVAQRILSITGELNKAQEKVATGKNINRPSDNPVGLVNA